MGFRPFVCIAILSVNANPPARAWIAKSPPARAAAELRNIVESPSDARITKARRPTRLYVIGLADMNRAERTLVSTLQGLIAKDHEEQIYFDLGPGSYEVWLQDLEDNYGVERVEVSDPWWLLDHFRDSVAGYLLFEEGNDSINAATSLAGVERAVVVEQSLEEQAISLGLDRVLDMRGLDEAWVAANHGHRLNNAVIFEQKASFEHQLRDYAVLSNAFFFYDGNSPFRDDVVDDVFPDAMLLGWGDASEGEDRFIRSSSERGVFTVPADHAHNLAPLSGIPARQQDQTDAPPAVAEPGIHYASFLFTDGDNAQWTLGHLQSDTRWFGSPRRGDFDMGWGFPPSFSLLAPSVMRWYYDHAATGPGRDHFVAGPSGGGYIYPSLYPAADLRKHVRRLAQWMALGDLNVVEILDFDALRRTDLWDVYTAHDAIDGLIYLEYGDHSADNGTLVWSNGKPVITPRVRLWEPLPGADRTTVINRINAAPRDPTSPFGYSLVIVGVWGHSLDDIQEIIDGLGPDTRVVTPGAMVELITENVPHGVSFHHDYTGLDFETQELVLAGNAFWTSDDDPLFAPHPDRLRITYNGGGQVGSAWWDGMIDPSQSWTTTFRFQFSYPAFGGADGLGFHIQRDGTWANPGHEGGNLSDPRLSVVIDTWNNGPEGTDESLKLILNGNQVYLNDLLDYEPDPNPGSSPTVFRLELSYVAATGELGIRFFDEGSSDALFDSAVGIDLSGFGPSHVGFSGTTGAATENHDVRTWTLNAATTQNSQQAVFDPQPRQPIPSFPPVRDHPVNTDRAPHSATGPVYSSRVASQTP